MAEGSDGEANTGEESWRGCSLAEIHRNLNEFELEHVPAVRPSKKHSVLHHFPIRAADTESPRPLKSQHKWDSHHVRLPCSTKSQYPVTADDGTSTIESRWEMIEKALLRPIASSKELQAAILAYNSKYSGQWNFHSLHRLFEEELDESEAQVFFEDLLPRIIRLALRLPQLVQSPIPLLKQGHAHSVTLTQEQVSCLLANAFLCTFPRRNTMKNKSEYSTFPDINFNRLFQSSGPQVLEKIKCICHYFRRVCPTERDTSNVPTGVVTFARRSLQGKELPKWAECEAPLGVTPLHITSTGTIEDQGLGLLQVDFANKFLGGGVLGSGCVQEEIRFVICPELLISKLFTESLRPTEALLMVGAERYSNYTGYANTFKWSGNHEDVLPRDSSRRRMTHIVAIDALHFVQPVHQYREELMLRELNKAYVGFYHELETPAPGIASGNWGCGAFGGEARLKALLQIMVCTVAKRPLVYFTFGNVELRDEVHRMHTFFIEENMRVRDLWAILKQFDAKQLTPKELYNFIYGCQRNHSVNPQRKRNSAPASSTSSTVERRSKTAEKPKPSSVQSASISQDLCATTSSDSGEETKTRKPWPAADTRINISDESDTEALLLAAAAEADCIAITAQQGERSSFSKFVDDSAQPAAAMTTQRQETPHKIRAEPRQRTLLEMLDQCYTVDESPASKRHKTTTKK